MSDSGSKNLSVAAGVGLAAAGLIVGLAGPRVVEKVVLKLKPGGKFSGVSVGAVRARNLKLRTPSAALFVVLQLRRVTELCGDGMHVA